MCSTRPSRVVPHRSTTRARSSLTALFGWEAVTLDDMAAHEISSGGTEEYIIIPRAGSSLLIVWACRGHALPRPRARPRRHAASSHRNKSRMSARRLTNLPGTSATTQEQIKAQKSRLCLRPRRRIPSPIRSPAPDAPLAPPPFPAAV